MYLIDEILVDEEISSTHFLCDLKKCSGGCCTIPGETGAPLLSSEIPVIEQYLDIIKKNLDVRSIDMINKQGFYQEKDNELSTNCHNGKDCVFVYYEKKDKHKIAYCGIEKAYNDGKIDFKKPLSCHLFPVRAGNFGGTSLFYDKMEVCKPALKNGEKKDVKIYEMTKESLIRAFGEEWYGKYTQFLNDLENREEKICS